MAVQLHTENLNRYVPRVLLARLATAPDESVQTLEGTVVFVDISGFTKLSERLQKIGKEGAERLADSINRCFTALLAEAYVNGGALLKFGGDALLLWFGGPEHAIRATASAVSMRRTLREIGRIRTGGSELRLRMSVGIHTGSYQTFLVGDSHREFILGGPAASTVVAMEGIAEAGQILMSSATALLLPERCLGERRGPGVLLARSPTSRFFAPEEEQVQVDPEHVAQCLPAEVRAHLLAAPAAPEHRNATVAFVQFGMLDAVIEESGPEQAAAALDQVVFVAQEAADRFEVCFLGTDIAAGGGKIILTAGAPRAVGDDEERIILALRQIVEARTHLPVRAGVHRGPVFAGEIGPSYRRTYTVMGDSVNLAARLMGKAPLDRIYATAGVLERSKTRFAAKGLAPFHVKGKTKPVQAWDVGAALRTSPAAAAAVRAPLIGRDRELGVLRAALQSAREGQGALIEIVGEVGSGKSRLLKETLALAQDMRFVHATCEQYSRDTPYVGWRDPLRQLLGMRWDDPRRRVLKRLREEVSANQPELLPWLPLLAIAFDADVPSTPEVNELSPEARTPKLHEAVHRFLAPALQIPTLVHIEHAHLMDAASSALLESLAAPLAESNWVIVVTRRDDEHGFVGKPAPALTVVELGPLTPQDALALAESTPAALTLPPHVLQLAVTRAGGSPEFLLDLLAAASSGSGELPDSIDGAATARIDALDPGDRALVRRASVLGLSFHPEKLRDVLDDDVAEPSEAAWERLSVIFARDPDGHVRFKRPALREVAYAGLPFKLRRSLHASIAEALERDVGSDVDADPAVLSLHSILAGDHARAWKYAIAGAERASARFAHADAARLYRRAIEAGRSDGASVTQLGHAWEALADCLLSAGEPGSAEAALAGARRLWTDDQVAQARLLSKSSLIAERSGSLTSAVRWARRGIAVLGDLESREATELRARLTAGLAAIRGLQGRHREAELLARTAIAEAEEVGEESALAWASKVLDTALVDDGRPDEAVHSARALAIYEQLGEFENQSSVLNNMGMFAYFRWEWDEAIELYRQAGERAERAGRSDYVAYTDCNVGEILSDQGRLAEAKLHLERAHRVWSATGNRGAGFTRIMLGRLAVREARYEAGMELLKSAVKTFGTLRSGGYADNARIILAEAEAFGGDPATALRITEKLKGVSDSYVPAPLLLRVRGIGLARLGDLEAALTALDESLAVARERDMQYEVAATIDALEALGFEDSGRAAQRDEIMERLGIMMLPRPQLAAARP